MKYQENNHCYLCLEEKPLRRSHIIPSFVFKWLKDTSATGYIRSLENANLRKQDGWKYRLLCSECESSFGKYETIFSKTIFHPYVSHELDKNGIAKGITNYYEYQDWLLKFIISIQWRIIISNNFMAKDFGKKFIDLIKSNAEIWRQFLIDKRNNTGENETYLIFLQNLASGYGSLPHNIYDRINHYLLRSIDFTTAYTDNKIALYFKLGPIAFITTLKPSRMKNVFDIKVGIKGKIKTAQNLNNSDIANFIFITRPNEMGEKYNISNRQQAIIDDYIKNNPDRVINSLSFGAAEGDLYLRELKKRK